MAGRRRRRYFYIYKKLVENERDMIGHIAYSLYKSEKVDHIEEYKKKNNVLEVPDSEIDAFTAGRDNERSIKHYRKIAADLLQEFIGGSFDEMSEQVVNRVSTNVTEHINNNVIPLMPEKESRKSKFWWSVAASVMAAILTTIVLPPVMRMYLKNMDGTANVREERINSQNDNMNEESTANFTDTLKKNDVAVGE